MSKNNNLHKAKTAKNDEFYTRYEDIANELKHYRKHFKGKTVLCNADDPRESNFFKFFTNNFEKLGLKKVIATCYKSQDVDLFSQQDGEQAVYQVYEGDKNGNRKVDDEEIAIQPLQGDGDFRSPEVIELLKEADIVVTNPPFSLFREFVDQLINYNKKFIILGNNNALTYKEIFKLFESNELWLGVGSNIYMPFIMPDSYELRSTGWEEDGKKYGKVPGISWFTNLDHKKRNEELVLYKEYSELEYPKFDLHDIININKVAEIPVDYNGVMAVPITFLGKYNPSQFNIVGYNNGGWKDFTINGEHKYGRIHIQKK